MRLAVSSIVFATLALCVALPSLAADDDFHITSAGHAEWQAGPDSLGGGSQMAVVSGDPTTKGPFVMRFKCPADYRVAWHTHPMVENLTLISAAAKRRTKMDDQPTDLAPGDFVYLPIGTADTVWTTDEPAVIQLTAVGPFEINYLKASDDPRNAK